MGRIFDVLVAMALVLPSLTCQGADAPAGAAGGDQYVAYSGTAVAPITRKFLYGERHVLKLRQGRLTERVVLYTCSDGAPFARKTVNYVDPLAPNFLLEDVSNGMRQGVRNSGGARAVFYREDGAQPERIGSLPSVPGLVADSGFDEFVRANWQTLMSGKTLTMHFLVPSRLDDMSFRVAHARTDTEDGASVEVFRLKLSSVLGWIAPSIDVYYDSKERVLVRYVGLSDLRSATHVNFETEISFRPDDRRVSGEYEVNDARQARLVPCK